MGGGFGSGPLIAATIGIVVMGLLRTPLRLAGGVVLAASIGWALLVKQPDVLIAGDGHSVAVRGRDGRLHVMRSAKDSFLLKVNGYFFKSLFYQLFWLMRVATVSVACQAGGQSALGPYWRARMS
jgi:hypothetical protein